ncbi:hypothetical protein XENOCAPTIV_000675 [Xenoophorus captivus]|uniref:Uncharacterized protein n=1 Tax=Xenoophorus captivus TaxID=1517983 RepID=A0ABV0S4I6_9TELE
MGENARNARVTTSNGSNGSVNVHIDMDQPVQSEPRLRLVLAENLLRDIQDVINRMEEREEDQRTLVQICECLRLLGNALVALSDLRLNLMSPVPRHLHVVRPFSHYTSPDRTLQQVDSKYPANQARVVFSRPPFAASMPPPAFGTRGTTINVRAAMPGQQPGQAFNPAALNQMISGLVGQLLMPGQMGPSPPSTANTTSTQNQAEAETGEPQPQDLAPDLGQLLGSLLGVAGASQPIFSPPPPTSGTTQAPAGPNPAANPAAAAAESLNPELFTGIVRGVLSTMMGSLGQAQNDTESIAQFMQRLSQATNIFISPEDPTGFFGELLMLVCQTFTMSDLVMLLHGQHQPLSRIQPQLSQFFTQNYLNGREPSDENIATAAQSLVNELEEYITESFRDPSSASGTQEAQSATTGQGSGSLLSLSDAVSQAARNAGVRPMTSPEQLQSDLETQEVKEAYSEQVTTFKAEDELRLNSAGGGCFAV